MLAGVAPIVEFAPGPICNTCVVGPGAGSTGGEGGRETPWEEQPEPFARSALVRTLPFTGGRASPGRAPPRKGSSCLPYCSMARKPRTRERARPKAGPSRENPHKDGYLYSSPFGPTILPDDTFFAAA